MDDEYFHLSYKTLPIPEPQRATFLPDVRAKAEFPSNPTHVDRPFWKYMVSHGRANAWDARNVLRLSVSDERPGQQAVFCFDRFGRTETGLPDGRVVYIGGEHEDFYDPDFYIYNDVVVVQRRDGGNEEEEEEVSDSDSDVSEDERLHMERMKAEEINENLQKAVSAAGVDPGDIDIYGYPEDIFPPTDFHTATYVKGSEGEYIYVIGGLGYGDGPHRKETLVHRLDLRDYSIRRMEASGEAPPPRSDTEEERRAELEGGRILYTVRSEEYVLCLEDMRWSKAKGD